MNASAAKEIPAAAAPPHSAPAPTPPPPADDHQIRGQITEENYVANRFFVPKELDRRGYTTLNDTDAHAALRTLAAEFAAANRPLGKMSDAMEDRISRAKGLTAAEKNGWNWARVLEYVYTFGRSLAKKPQDIVRMVVHPDVRKALIAKKAEKRKAVEKDAVKRAKHIDSEAGSPLASSSSSLSSYYADVELAHALSLSESPEPHPDEPVIASSFDAPTEVAAAVSSSSASFITPVLAPAPRVASPPPLVPVALAAAPPAVAAAVAAMVPALPPSMSADDLVKFYTAVAAGLVQVAELATAAHMKK